MNETANGTGDGSGSEHAAQAMVRGGATMVVAAGSAMVGAFHRITDAVRAALALRDDLPASRISLCTGETGARGEFARVLDKAARLVDASEPGATVLSRLTGSLAMDHLPDGRTLCERHAPGADPHYVLA